MILSENSEFAEQCSSCNINFIGQKLKQLVKWETKHGPETVSKAGVPIIPGSDGPIENEKDAIKVAQKIGFPVIIKQ